MKIISTFQFPSPKKAHRKKALIYTPGEFLVLFFPRKNQTLTQGISDFFFSFENFSRKTQKKTIKTEKRRREKKEDEKENQEQNQKEKMNVSVAVVCVFLQIF